MEISYETLNSLGEQPLIAGSNFTMTFNIYDDSGSPLDISSGTAKWTLCPFGQPSYAVLTKTGTIPSGNHYQFSVTLTTADTKSLSGKYIQQPILVDFSSEEYRVAQGVILFLPRIQNT